MASRTRARLTWTLAVLVAALCVGREELHRVPGLGHVTLVGQLFLRFGLPHPKGALYAVGDGRTVVHSPNESFPIRDSGTCPICKDKAQMQVLSAAVDWDTTPTLLEKLAAVRAPVLDRLLVRRAFQARAPPAA